MTQTVFSEISADTHRFFKEFFSVLRKFRTAILLLVVVVLVSVLLLLPYDHPVSDHFATTAKEPWLHIAHGLRSWGDFRDTVTVTVLIYASGCFFRRRSWRRLALAFFLSASVSGIGVNILRFTTGRPRPYVENVKDGWYGPVMLYPKRWIPQGAKIFAFQSFPSGHAGTSVGGATMLIIACPPVGIPMALSAGGIIWASLYVNQHHVTDLIVGSMIGMVFGAAGGLACRRMRFKGDNIPEAS